MACGPPHEKRRVGFLQSRLREGLAAVVRQSAGHRSSPRSRSALFSHTSPAFGHARQLLGQLVSQRLRHDFQIVTETESNWNADGQGGGIGGAISPRARFITGTQRGGSIMGSSGGMSRDQTETGWSGHREYLMSRGNYFHKLTVDPDKPSEVTVSRYTPKILPYGKEDA